MRNTLRACLLLALPLMADDPQTEESLETEVKVPVALDYLLAKPAGYDQDASRRWPLIVFLHGSGERGDDLALVRKHGPPKLLAAGGTIPAIVASPQCPADEIWNPHAVHALTRTLIDSHRIDPDRVYLTGISMGGFGTWETAFEYPDTYAAIAPICGGCGVRRLMAAKLAEMPCWIFHGGADEVVPPENSTRIHAALEALGAPVKLTIYEGVGHDSWTRTYENPEFWTWLLARNRT